MQSGSLWAVLFIVFGRGSVIATYQSLVVQVIDWAIAGALRWHSLAELITDAWFEELPKALLAELRTKRLL